MKNRASILRHPPCKERLPAIEVLVAALCCLMTQYAREPDVSLSPQILRHLELLERHPDCDSDLLRSMCRRLSLHWLGLAENRGTPNPYPFVHQGKRHA